MKLAKFIEYIALKVDKCVVIALFLIGNFEKL